MFGLFRTLSDRLLSMLVPAASATACYGGYCYYQCRSRCGYSCGRRRYCCISTSTCAGGCGAWHNVVECGFG